MFKFKSFLSPIIFLLVFFHTIGASSLVEMKVLDNNYLVFHFEDGIVTFVDDGQGPYAYTDHTDPDDNEAVWYGAALNVVKVADVNNWLIKSADDDNYGETGITPVATYRKSKVNGMSQEEWQTSDWHFDYTMEHFIYLQLPYALEENKTYTVEINETINSDTTSQSITYDIFNCPSEAVHTNLVGYMSSSRIKAADLYHFVGDGGNRDYSEFVGNEVYIYNVSSGESQSIGTVQFWMKNKKETNHNLTGSDIWIIDFTGFSQIGTFRLAVEGVGCSEDFEIRDDIYHDPFKVSVLGYFYMRIGQDNLDMTPVPRRPLYIPGQDPITCKIYITDMDPYHPDWETFTSGDKWDKPQDWAAYRKSGYPTNSKAVGGHSDAFDWDRHLGHVVNIYDLCLAYILSDGELNDDDLRIAESGNGIPDILDEARNEVDFWLSLRYNGGYSHGLTNPGSGSVLYQADNTPIAAWANALNSAMLAYCFQIAGLSDLKNTYQDSAVIAFNYANNLTDPMLDTKMEGIRGIDFKMMSAAYLYNLTGNTDYEDIMNSTCMVTSSSSSIYQQGSYNQLWGVAAYLLTKRSFNYPDLYTNMKSAVIAKAKSKESDYINERPSRRAYSIEQSWWQTNQDIPRTVLAHAITDNPTDALTFLDALLLEADWGLGRNPLNMIQMTTATTELADKRSVENCYTSGWNDGSPGVHPGHTPYLNTQGWGGEMVGSNPGKVFEKFYPSIENWAHASKYINTRYIWAHSEFTPRQTMRGKTLLYAYLYSLSKSGSSITPVIVADAGVDQRIIDEDEDGKETVQLDGSKSYSSHSEIESYKWSMNNSVIDSGKTISVELNIGSYEIILEVKDSNKESARDTVKIDIVSPSPEQEADYDFETATQFNDWIAENFNQIGGASIAIHSNAIARSGEYSFQISGNFSAESEHSLRRNSSLDDGVISLIYHVWVPQVLVDSAYAVNERDSTRVGGIQNYLMHDGWQWFSEWLSIKNLKGNEWNELELMIPGDVRNSSLQAFGISFKLLDIDVGEASVFIDDIYFKKEPTLIDDHRIERKNPPIKFDLFVNYPNPFNPSTTISFALPNQELVELNVFNMLGQKIKTLVNERKSAGVYSVNFEAGNLSSGVYFYRLKAGQFVQIKKMILL